MARPSERPGVPGFEPSFDNLQKDVERYLTASGKREITAAGLSRFHGYDDALQSMFERYIRQQVFDPLVSHFRRWNWEYTYNAYLLELTDALIGTRDWPRLKRLWDGVIAKRRKLCKDLRNIAKQSPDGLNPQTLEQATARLRETLLRVAAMATHLGALDDAVAYNRMIQRLEAEKAPNG